MMVVRRLAGEPLILHKVVLMMIRVTFGWLTTDPTGRSASDGRATAGWWTPVPCKRLLVMKSDVTSVTRRRLFHYMAVGTCAVILVKDVEVINSEV